MTEADVHATLTEHLIRHLRHSHAGTGEVRVVHTHISTVLLAGEFAYKLKRPVRLPFLDFSTLARRHHFLQEELRLNRRTAPELYLDLLPITGHPHAPQLGGTGPAIEWALRMRRFGPGGDFRAMAEAGTLTPRLTLARKQLLSGNALKQIAPAVGYQSVAAFHRVFRQRFGVSPKEWLEQLQSPLAEAAA
mgnify:CR=1 FL=1